MTVENARAGQGLLAPRGPASGEAMPARAKIVSIVLLFLVAAAGVTVGVLLLLRRNAHGVFMVLVGGGAMIGALYLLCCCSEGEWARMCDPWPRTELRSLTANVV